MRLAPLRDAALALTLAACAGPASADSESLGDSTLTGLVAVTIGSTFWQDDSEGGWMLVKSAAASLAANNTIKLALNDTDFGKRPNGKGYGFPSGHAGAAAACASFLQGRYGWKWGLPGWIATGYISYVRVEQSGHHRWRDIAAGVAIAQASAWYFVDAQQESRLSLGPILDGETAGMSLSYRF